MRAAQLRIDEPGRRIVEHGHNGRQRTVAGIPAGMSALEARRCLEAHQAMRPIPAGTQDAGKERRAWVREALTAWKGVEK